MGRLVVIYEDESGVRQVVGIPPRTTDLTADAKHVSMEGFQMFQNDEYYWIPAHQIKKIRIVL